VNHESSLSSRIYGRLVALYPDDLRREYGDEMAFVFAEELRDTNLTGAIRVWRNALSEFFRFALPACAEKSAIRVPAISIAFTIFSLTAEFVMHYAVDSPVRFVIASIFPIYGALIVPVAVAFACRAHAPLLLDVCKSPREKAQCAKSAI
jgi:hypothetical protein